MYKFINIVSSGGAGDCLLALKFAKLLKIRGYDPIVYLAVRNEVFAPICYLFGGEYSLGQIPEEENEETSIRRGGAVLEKFKKDFYIEPTEDVIYLCPDSLFANCEYEKFGLRPQSIKETKIGEHLWSPEKIIFASLNSSTPAYMLGDRIPSILRQLGLQNPNHVIYYNKISEWNGTKINNFDLGNLPKNVQIFENQSFIDSLEWLKRSEYVVTVDCGPMHLAYEMGIPHVLLDTRLGGQGLPWSARWRYSSDYSIPSNTDSISLARLVKTNIEVPATSLINRQIVLNNLDADWKQVLLIKGY